MTVTIRPRRRAAVVATVLFLAVYAAVMVLILTPRDMIGATPASMLHATE